MSKILSFTVEVSDQEFATFMERIGVRANVTSTAIPANAGKPAAEESDEADDDEPAAAVAPSGADVDADGVPHNPTVHASTKGKTAEGVWKRLKGVSKEAYDAFAAPYKAAKASPASTAPAASAITVPPLPGAAPSVVPGLPGASFPALVPPAPDVPVSYEELIAKFGALQAAGKSMEASVITPIYQKIGLTDLNTLQTNETLRKALMTELNAL